MKAKIITLISGSFAVICAGWAVGLAAPIFWTWLKATGAAAKMSAVANAKAFAAFQNEEPLTVAVILFVTGAAFALVAFASWKVGRSDKEPDRIDIDMGSPRKAERARHSWEQEQGIEPR